MIPTLFTGSVLIAPGSALISSGYVAGNTLAAQHLNYYLYHLTAELNNLIAAAGISQSTADDSQVLKAVRAPTQVSVSAGGTTTISALAFPTQIVCTNGTAATVDISAGATVAGTVLTISVKSGVGITIQTGTGMTAFLGSGSIGLSWNGTAWSKIGGAKIRLVFTSGTAATVKVPFTGNYDVTATGGGAGGGGAKVTGTVSNVTSAGAGGGASGGTAIKNYFLIAGATFTYTVGAAGTAGTSTPTDGGNGGDTTVSDGTTVITGGGGRGGISITNGGPTGNVFVGAAGGVATNGDINIIGDGGEATVALVPGGSLAWNQFFRGGKGGRSIYGGGAPGTGGSVTAGIAATGYGSGGSGASVSSNSTQSAAGGAGMSGLVTIEF